MGRIMHMHGDRKGGKRERLYRIWDGMIGRCERPSQKRYFLYGGRGISVCTEWRGNYIVFKEWALSNGYSDKLTLDRIDNDKGYTPENCRWVTYEEQSANRRNAVFIEVNGVKKTVAQLVKEYGISRDTIYFRLRKSKDASYILRPVRNKTTKSSCAK